mmetsp:Transcript_56528/g.129815  ORF Transcript_56528/g.129815 Transcript_56528/m.129815 type:complete len:84 (+) Transcript_56528:583-834(+)
MVAVAGKEHIQAVGEAPFRNTEFCVPQDQTLRIDHVIQTARRAMITRMQIATFDSWTGYVRALPTPPQVRLRHHATVLLSDFT